MGNEAQAKNPEDDMAKNLVIVESPAKVKTIKKFLGSNYEVEASMGHVRDLPKSQLGIDTENDFEPKYITIRGKGDLLAKLRKEAKGAGTVYLATDPDREGEAISWHLITALNLEPKKVRRISFNEITKNAVKDSMKNPRAIDMNLVDAQQARRALDRVVGYKISPVLWAKVKRGLSAGRVQSVALRIIADREEEISSFIPQEYWTIDCDFDLPGSKKGLSARFYGTDVRMELNCEKDAQDVIDAVSRETFTVREVRRSTRTKKAPLPFTTSTMQQEASKQLNFTTAKTMRVAQQLYEGVDVKGRGTVGLITYLRTDSTRISEEAGETAREYIRTTYGEEAVGTVSRGDKNTRNAQDAHEAIRPTDISLTPVLVKDSLSRDQFRLYQLIWKRFAASVMADAVYDTVNIRIEAGQYAFVSSASQIQSAGFLNVYSSDEDEKNSGDMALAKLTEGQELALKELTKEQHFTQAPPHYTEASLVKALEELGIGRPSTYAPIISTILGRHYITKEQKNLYITELGEVVNSLLKQAFPNVVDQNFTANLENRLDEVAEGTIEWKEVLRDFYPEFEKSVEAANEELAAVKIEDEVTDIICENCGRNMVIKYGPHGKFLACPGFPECRNTKPFYETTGVACPKCGGDVVVKRTRKGRRYYGCVNNPECDFMSWAKPVAERCPKCGSYMVERGNSYVCGNEHCGYKMPKPKAEDSELSRKDE